MLGMKRTILIGSTFLVTTFACREPEQERRTREEPVTRTEPAPPVDRGETARTEQQPTESKESIAAREAAEAAKEKAAKEAEEAAAALKQSALGHMPEGCKAVTHLRTTELATLPGAMEHLLPAVWDAKSKDQEISDLANAFLDAGIVSPKDLESIAICVMDAPTAKEAMEDPKAVQRKTDVVVAAKGTAPKGQLVKALAEKRAATGEILQMEGIDVFHDKERNVYVGQLDDGTIIGGLNPTTFTKGMKGGGDYKMPMEPALAIVFPKDTVTYVIDRFADPAAKKLAADVERSAIVFDAKQKQLALRVDMPDHTRAAELGGLFKARLETWKAQAPTDPMEARFASLLKDANVGYEDDILVMQVPVSDEQIEATMKNLSQPFRIVAPSGA